MVYAPDLDRLVWDQISTLLRSPDLLRNAWVAQRQQGSLGSPNVVEVELTRIIHELRASVTSRRFFASAALWREVLRCSRRHGSLPNGSNVSARTRSAFVASPFDRNRANLDLRDRFDDGFRA